MLKEFLAGATLFLASLFGIQPAQPAAVAIAPDISPSSHVDGSPPPSSPSPLLALTEVTTVAEIVEREGSPPTFVTQAELAAAIAALRGSLAFNGAGPAAGVSTGFHALQVNRIYDSVGTGIVDTRDALTDRINNLTVDDIPDLSGAYLALTGGTLAGDLTVTGNFTVSGAQTLSGAITIPYLSATSSIASSFIQASSTRLSVFDAAYFGGTATSTFDASGSLTIAGTLGITNLTSALLATNAQGNVVATSSVSVNYLAGTLGITKGGTGTSTPGAWGDLLAWNGAAWQGAATSSLGLPTFNSISSTLTAYLSVAEFVASTSPEHITSLPNLIVLTSKISGILDVAKGGTGLTAVQAGSIVFGNGGNPLATSSALQFDAAMSRLTVTNASTTNLSIGSLTGLLKQQNGIVVAAVAGTDYATPSQIGAAYPFPLISNATSTLTQFNGGLTAYASSTIGNGSEGLTISGAATTTGRAYFAGNVGIGTTSPAWKFVVDGSTSDTILQLSNAGTGGRGWLIDSTNNSSGIGGGKFAILDATAGNQTRMVIDASGNVGIGTTTPAHLFTVSGGSSASTLLTGTGNVNMRMQNYGTSGRAWRLIASDSSELLNGGFGLFDDTAGEYRLAVNSSGNVGIGQTSPDQGKVEVKGGTVCVDTNSDDNASSCIASESDERLKTNIQPLSASTSLATILALNPVSFDWRVNDPEVLSHYSLISRFADNPHSIGLVAQQVAPVVPEAIEQETVGDAEVQYYQLDYTKFIPHLIGAVKELSTRVQDLMATVAGFADQLVSTEIVAVNIVADDITARNRLCVGTTCLTEDDVKALLNGDTVSPSPSVSLPELGEAASEEPDENDVEEPLSDQPDESPAEPEEVLDEQEAKELEVASP